MALSKQAGEQRDKGKADKGNAAARHQLFHALRLKICTILHEERKRVKKYTHNVDRGETLWVLSKMRNWLFNFHAGLFPYSCPIQTIQNHSGSGITDYHRVPYTFYAHVKHC